MSIKYPNGTSESVKSGKITIPNNTELEFTVNVPQSDPPVICSIIKDTDTVITANPTAVEKSTCSAKITFTWKNDGNSPCSSEVRIVLSHVAMTDSSHLFNIQMTTPNRQSENTLSKNKTTLANESFV